MARTKSEYFNFAMPDGSFVLAGMIVKRTTNWKHPIGKRAPPKGAGCSDTISRSQEGGNIVNRLTATTVHKENSDIA